MIRRAVTVAGIIVALLALGPFATPQVTDGVVDDVASTPGPADHRNDLPVVQPERRVGTTGTARGAPSHGLFVVLALVGAFLATGSDRHRPRRQPVRVACRPPWSRPPRRGPPLLLAH